MEKIEKDKLHEILEKHIKWRNGEENGERAYLRYADLSGADLSGADLSGADLSGADLSGAYLSGAYLSGAYLSDANLSGAYLSDANLSDANLSDAYLRYANLSDADLSGADLSGADLSGANTKSVIGYKIFSVDNVGSRNSKTTYLADVDVVYCGCFKGTLQEFINQVKETYPEVENKYRKQYEAVITLFHALRDFDDIQ